MSDSVRHHRRQPNRFPRPWDSPGNNTGVGCHSLLQCLKVKSESEVAQSCLTPSDPWTAAYQAPPSMGFSRQEYWSGVPLPSLGATFSHKPGKLRIKKTYFRTSPMAQWIGICLLMQGTQVRSLAWGDPTYCGAAKPMHQNYQSLRALEPRLCSKRSRAVQLESSPTVCSRRRPPPTNTSTAKNKCIQEKKV